MKTHAMYSLVSLMLMTTLVSCSTPPSEQTAKVVELVVYQPKEGISEQEALEKAQSVNEFIQAQDGFISRTLSKTADGRWVDIIFWESKAQAEQANKKAMQTEAPLNFFTIIDESSVTFLHADKVLHLMN